MIEILYIIVLLFFISELIANYKPFLKDKREVNNAYYHFKDNKYVRDYTAINFKGIGDELILFRIYRGYHYDRELTICNISFIFPRKTTK